MFLRAFTIYVLCLEEVHLLDAACDADPSLAERRFSLECRASSVPVTSVVSFIRDALELWVVDSAIQHWSLVSNV
jgi:hypothetical protein